MKARIVVAATADDDVDFILADLAARAGWPVAVRYEALFETLYDRLADYPASGSRRPVLGVQIRVAMAIPYVVIYRYDRIGRAVTILRILHGRRDLAAARLA